MAVSYVWPLTLPQAPTTGYTESTGALILRTPMDAGPAKQRRRGNRPDVLGVSFIMSTAQVEALRTFVADTIRGTARFGFPHPRTQVQAEVRIVPQDGGELFSVSYYTPNHWTVGMSLEVLP